MKLNVLLLAACTAGLASCSLLHLASGGSAEDHLHAGLAALDTADYARAMRELTAAYQASPSASDGRHALLALAAVELDPRNPDRRLDEGARLAGGYLRLPPDQSWVSPAASSLYLMALELGAVTARVDSAQAQADSARAEAAAARRTMARFERVLPKLPGQPITVRLARLQAERDTLQARVHQLDDALAEKDRQLAEKTEEIQRIRRTLRP